MLKISQLRESEKFGSHIHVFKIFVIVRSRLDGLTKIQTQ